MNTSQSRAISLMLWRLLKHDYTGDPDAFTKQPVDVQRDLLVQLVLTQNREWLHLHHRLDKVLSQLRKRGIVLKMTP